MGLGILPADARPTTEPATESTGPADDSSDAYPRTRIIIGSSADDPGIDAEELRQALAGHLADTGLRSTVTSLGGRSGDDGKRRWLAWASRHAEERDVLAVFWIERSGDERRLFLFEPQQGTTWVRALPESSDPDELVESLGTMLRGISLFLETGPPEGMAPVTPPAAEESKDPEESAKDTHGRPPPPIPSAPPPPSTLWTLELAYAGGNLARDAPWQSGGSLALDIEWPVPVVGRVSVAAMSPAILRDVPRTSVWRIPVSIGAGIRFRRHHDVRPWVDAAAVIEPMWWQVRPAPGVDARPGRTVRVAVAPGAGLRWRLRGGWGLTLHARMDIRVREATLVVSQGGERVPRLSPHPVAVFARAGASYSF